MTTVAEEDVLSAVELDLTVDPIADETGASTGSDAAALSAEATAEPVFRVVKGSPSDEELAALVCVLSAVANSAAPTGPARGRKVVPGMTKAPQPTLHPKASAHAPSPERYAGTSRNFVFSVII